MMLGGFMTTYGIKRLIISPPSFRARPLPERTFPDFVAPSGLVPFWLRRLPGGF